MTEIITYSLKTTDLNSDKYYCEIAAFADEVLLNGREIIGSIIVKYKDYIQKNYIEDVRSDEEYTLELLTLGILWQLYSDDALDLSELPKSVIRRLVELRKKSSNVKACADFLRGILATIFLSQNDNDNSTIKLSIDSFNRFINWLLATGEFDEEVKRFSNWEKYFGQLSVEALEKVFEATAVFALWFDMRSKTVLGKYTCNVKSFLKNKYPKHRFKEDVVLCGRKRIEYHLNMVGAEILNRAFREDFIKTKVKKLLLPVCMRQKAEGLCMAKKTTDGYICQKCCSECRVNYLTRLGEKYNFQVLIIPHSSSAFSEKKIEYGKVGIVGVACLLNLLNGGWKARSLNLVPQCVILDYCGCKKHWHDTGIITDINLNQLKKIFRIEE